MAGERTVNQEKSGRIGNMIKGGYYLKARQIENSEINNAAPCTREVWDYLLRKANFANSKNLKRGQLIKSYSEILESLSWKTGNTYKKYSENQIKWAMSFLRKHEMILTKRVTRGVLITICNYKYFQNKQNYEPTETKFQSASKINHLEQNSKPEPTETTAEPTEICPTEPTTEPTETKFQSASKINHLEQNSKPEPTTEPTAEPTEICPTIDNNISIISMYSIYNKNFPCEKDELEFERDRRIFFHSFPGVKTIQTFDDNQDRKSKKLVKQFHVKDNMPVKVTNELEARNQYGAGIYLTINETNGKSRTAEDILKVRAVFADFDGADLDPVWGYNPSIVLESSPGKYHAYWLAELDDINGVPLESFRTLQESIAKKFKSDPKVKDLPRVMRFPGFEHRKAEPFLSRIIHFENRRYSFGDLVDLFPPIPVKQWSAPKFQKVKNLDPNAEFKGTYGASKGGRNNHIAFRIGGMLNRGLSWTEIEQEAFKEAYACSPPLSESETRAILNSMRRYG